MSTTSEVLDLITKVVVIFGVCVHSYVMLAHLRRGR